MSQRIRLLVRVEGIVQGVGFRPFVYGLATSLRLGGMVGNDLDGVFAEVEGAAEAVTEFLAALERQAPPLASVERVTTSSLPPAGDMSFAIAPSPAGDRRRVLVLADSATCADCLAEMRDPADRRFGYPFINCTNCGPRFTIISDVPYDRRHTTMSDFPMCELCAAEYHDPADRRFHAQPVCCPACGPALRLACDAAAGHPPPTARVPPLTAAAALLARGGVLAVKGLGGYHLAVDAANEAAAAALRARKHREEKPFALMVADLAAARRLCEVDETGAALLTSRHRPIVLLRRLPALPRPPALPRADAIPPAVQAVAPSVAPGNRELGIMLPYTPLHHLLLGEFGRPIVLTSGNVSDEPIVYTDTTARTRLAGIADAFLTHDRAIGVRADDSVARPVRGRPALIRRSRGYAPEPVTVRTRFRRPVLACGAELKNTFCLARDNHAVISQHIGDLENAETLRSFTDGIAHLCRLLGIEPALVAHDLHPDYLSTKYAHDLAAASAGHVELAGVQHHHAHIASCLADNGTDGPVIGVAFDGTGYGSDGTIWGGEFLVADLAGFERAGHLRQVPMPGGAAAIRQPWRMAAAYLDAAGLLDRAGQPELAGPATGPGAGGAGTGRAGAGGAASRNEQLWAPVVAMARKGINSPVTSSAGRLFDAVAAILGVRDSISYEGQAAVELEQLADVTERSGYLAAILPGGQADAGTRARAADGTAPFVADGCDLIRAVVDDLAAGTGRSVVAARFHNGMAAVIEAGCVAVRERHGLRTVALSGGVFQNVLLLDGVVGRLEARGFTVLLHSRVPCNDGGISLGQAVVAGTRDSRL